MITLLINYESFSRILSPVPIHFAEAIPIAFLGLAVNVASAWLLAGGDHHHGHRLSQERHDHDEHTASRHKKAWVILEIFEDWSVTAFPPALRSRAIARCTLNCHQDHAARGDIPAIQYDEARGLSGIS